MDDASSPWRRSGAGPDWVPCGHGRITPSHLRARLRPRRELLLAAGPSWRRMQNEPACKPDPVPPGGPGAATIHLGPSLPTASSDLPGSSGGPPSNAPCLTLLRVGFTEPRWSPSALVVSYTTVSPLPGAEAPGGLLSVALSRGSPRVGVTHHPALWSPDFPRRRSVDRRRGRPADSFCAANSTGAPPVGVTFVQVSSAFPLPAAQRR